MSKIIIDGMIQDVIDYALSLPAIQLKPVYEVGNITEYLTHSLSHYFEAKGGYAHSGDEVATLDMDQVKHEITVALYEIGIKGYSDGKQ